MKISIVTATYNSARTVEDTFKSVLRQNYDEYEHIIIDGASTDNTLELINKYQREDPRHVIWFSKPDCGIYDAMNKGISLATGDIVGILNSDDFYSSEDVLSTIASAFDLDNELDAVYADVQYVDWNNTDKKGRYYSSKIFQPSLMRYGFMPAHPSFYCKKMVYDKYRLDGRTIKGYKGNPDIAYFNTSFKIAADFDNLLRMIYLGKIKTCYVRKEFVRMRVGGASSSGVSSHLRINREHQMSFRQNGVYSNLFMESLRYLYKIWEVIKSTIN